MDGWLAIWMGRSMIDWLDGWMDVRLDGFMARWVGRLMDVWLVGWMTKLIER